MTGGDCMTAETAAADFEDDAKGLADYLAAFRRRKKPILIVGSVILLLVVLVALFWPPTFESTATILIEEQEIPPDMVRSTITSYANQEIQTITQRVMTLRNIMSIVEKYHVYNEKTLENTPRTDIAQKFQNSMNLNVINADVIDPKSGRPTQATIAFSLSFDAGDPTTAQQVANELVNLYLNENIKTRTEQAQGTTDFLKQQSQDQAKQLDIMEQQLAVFKRKHQEALPENYQYNVQMTGRLQSQISDIDSQIKNIEQQEISLRARLAQTNKYAPKVLASGDTVLSDVDRLEALQSQYRKEAAIYKPDHPELIRLRREIDSLAAEVGHEGNKDDLKRLLADRENELAQLKSKYSDKYPKVVALQNLIAELKKQLTMADDNSDQATPDNPAYLVLQSQLDSMEADKRLLRQQQEGLRQQIAQMDKAIQQEPEVEKKYNEILRNVQVAKDSLVDLQSKLKEAELAGQLEAGRKGQRFSLIEPPDLPQQPVSPNRLAILLVGIVLAVGAGLGTGLAMDSFDTGIYGERGLSLATGAPPLATIGYVKTPLEQARDRPNRKLLIALMVLIVAGVIGLILINYFYKPLDVLWYLILQKLGMG